MSASPHGEPNPLAPDAGPLDPDKSGDGHVRVAGIRVDPLTMADTLGLISRHVETPGLSHHAGVNASKLVEASEDPEFKRVLEEADIVNADGMSVVWASRLLGTPVPERVTGIDTIPYLLRLSAERGWPIYLLGAKPDVVAKLAADLPTQYPGLRVVGARDGYWSDSEEVEIVADVKRSGAKVLLLGLPSPRKEFFVDRHQSELGATFAMGVGGSFDVIAGKIPRAPLWMQRSGLEWAHRFLREPRRLWRRYTVENVKFIFFIAAQAMRRPHTKHEWTGER